VVPPPLEPPPLEPPRVAAQFVAGAAPRPRGALVAGAWVRVGRGPVVRVGETLGETLGDGL
jgi:hypothetical protein